MLSVREPRSTERIAESSEKADLRPWEALFGVLGGLALVSTLAWLVVAYRRYGAIEATSGYSSGFGVERSLAAQVEYYSALYWAFVSGCSAVANFFFSALMKAADEGLRLLRSLARTHHD